MATENGKNPVELKQVFFTRMEIVSLAEHNGEPKERLKHPPKNAVKVEADSSAENQYMFGMRCILNPDKDPDDPYFADLECMAIFTANPELSKEEAARAVTVIGHSVVYGAIREALAWMTSRHPFGAIALGLSWLTPPPPKEEKTVAEAAAE